MLLGQFGLNDWSIRNDMNPGRPMSSNLPKNFDGSTSLGPSIMVGEFDLQAIAIQTRVNGQVRQDYNTRELTFLEYHDAHHRVIQRAAVPQRVRTRPRAQFGSSSRQGCLSGGG